MPTEQPDGNIRDLKDFKDIQRACCKAILLSLVAHKGPADIYIYTNPRYVPYIFPCVFLNLWSQNPLCVSLIWFKEACL